MNHVAPQTAGANSDSISIITATLNSEDDLPRLLNSLRQQTDRNFELIIVDGGSRDSTWRIIQAHADVVTVAIGEPDHGLYDALNKGIRASNSDFYVVLGADDTFRPDAIANYKAALRASGADVIVAAVMAGGVIRRGFSRHRAWLGHSAMVTSHSVGMLFRKALHDRFGYYSLRYSLLADGLFIKQVCTSDKVRVTAVPFVAGEFGTAGSSNRDVARALFETWQIQLDTGENPFIQYLLFQFRLFKRLPVILLRPSRREKKADSAV